MTRPTFERQAGFTLVEVSAATVVVVVGLVSLAALNVSIARQSESIATERVVLEECASLMEELKGTLPDSIPAVYDKRLYRLPTIEGLHASGATIRVLVDTTTPRLLVVTLEAAWQVLGLSRNLQLTTEIYSGTRT